MLAKTTPLIRVVVRCYRWLVNVYPVSFRQRYAEELVQVFRECCQDAYRECGAWGIVRLWPPMLFDLVRSAARQHVIQLLKGNSNMTDLTAFDRQLGNAVDAMSMLLRAGYSVIQCLEQIAARAPEPLAGIFRGVLEEIKSGKPALQALDDALQRVPSVHLRRVIATMKQQREIQGNLAQMLEPVAPSIRSAAGTDEQTAAMLQDIRDLTNVHPNP